MSATHPEGFPSALGTICHGKAAHRVPHFERHPTQHHVAREVDDIVHEAVVQAQLGHHAIGEMANGLKFCTAKQLQQQVRKRVSGRWGKSYF